MPVIRDARRVKIHQAVGFLYVHFSVYMLIQSLKGNIPVGLVWVRDAREMRQETG